MSSKLVGNDKWITNGFSLTSFIIQHVEAVAVRSCGDDYDSDDYSDDDYNDDDSDDDDDDDGDDYDSDDYSDDDYNDDDDNDDYSDDGDSDYDGDNDDDDVCTCNGVVLAVTVQIDRQMDRQIQIDR